MPELNLSQFDLIYMFYGGIIVIGLTVLITVLVATLSRIRRAAKGVENLTDVVAKEVEPTMTRMRDLLERIALSVKAFDRLSEGVETISGSVRKLSSAADGSGNSTPPSPTMNKESRLDESSLNMVSQFKQELKNQMEGRAEQAREEMMRTVVEEILNETRSMVEEESKKLESLIEAGREMLHREREAPKAAEEELSENYRRGNPAEE